VSVPVKAVSAVSVLLLSALGGCQQIGVPAPEPEVAFPYRARGVDGDWIGADDVAVSSLHQGRFESRSLKTGERLTSGNYSYSDPRTITLSFYSVKSRRQTAATCLLVDADRMNCTLASGQQFVLNRRRSQSGYGMSQGNPRQVSTLTAADPAASLPY